MLPITTNRRTNSRQTIPQSTTPMAEQSLMVNTCASCAHAIHPQLNPDKIRKRGGDSAHVPPGCCHFCQIFDAWTGPAQTCSDYSHVRNGYDANFD
jgi:hypothetical protein